MTSLPSEIVGQSSSASLEDYRHFHGMLCQPKTANRCIDSFTGRVMFMDCDYGPSTLKTYDFSGGLLTLLSYYMLCLSSLTSLSTVLGMTNFITAKEYEKVENNSTILVASHNDELQVEDFVLQYCKDYTGATSLDLVRRFEYRFRLTGLDVVMFHLRCNQNKLHLVEVYQLQNGILSALWKLQSLAYRKIVLPFLRLWRTSLPSRKNIKSN